MSNSREYQALVYDLTRFQHELGFGTATSTQCRREGRFYGSYTVLEKAIPYTDGTSYASFFFRGGGGLKCQRFGICLILAMECSDIVVVSADMPTFWQNLSKIKANWWGKPPITSHFPWHNLDTKAFRLHKIGKLQRGSRGGSIVPRQSF